MPDFSKFEELELTGWQERAAGYDQTTLVMTGSTIPRLLDIADIRPEHQVLDVCCGTGEVAKQAARKSSHITGLDFSPSMIKSSQAKLPEGRFIEGDAQDLPFEAEVFDVVLTNFGHYHLADANQAISEAARVLRPGGTYCFTTWCGPETSPGFKMILDTILANIDPEIALPAAPDAFRLSDPQVACAVMTDFGFENVTVETYPSTITCKAEEFAVFLKAATVRATMILKAQREDTQAKIEALLLERAREFAIDGVVDLPLPSRIIKGIRSTSSGN